MAVEGGGGGALIVRVVRLTSQGPASAAVQLRPEQPVKPEQPQPKGVLVGQDWLRSNTGGDRAADRKGSVTASAGAPLSIAASWASHSEAEGDAAVGTV